jgi:hypothetical protein
MRGVWQLGLAVTLATVEVLLTPVSYDSGLVARADGTPVVSILVIRVSAVDPEGLSSEQTMLWRDLSARIRATYGGASRRQRARLTTEVLTLQAASRSSDYSLWLRFPSGEITRAERLSYPSTGSVWRLVDLTSGQYVAVVRWSDASELTALVKEYLKEPTSEAALQRVRNEGEDVEARTEALVEVNGQRQYLPRGSVTRGSLEAELAALLPNLLDDGRTRILNSLALLEAIRGGAVEGDADLKGTAMLCGAPFDVAALALPPIPNTFKLKPIAQRSTFLEPPEAAAVADFFGDRGWRPPDLQMSFKAQVRKLLSGAS